MNRTITQITPEELAQVQHIPAVPNFYRADINQNTYSEIKPDVNSTKYLNQIPLEDLYEFFVPFGISDPTQMVPVIKDGKISALKLYCDDFNAFLDSDFNFQFGFFDQSAGDHYSLGKTIRYYEINEFSDFLGLSKSQTMSLLLTGFFVSKFPNYKQEWKQLLEAGEIPIFKDRKLPEAFRNFNNISTIFSLAREISDSHSEGLSKQLF